MGLELCWLLEPIALRVHNRYYRKRDLGHGGVGTASATVVGATDNQEVVVCYLFGVACRLHIAHHKLIFHGYSLHHSLLLFLFEGRISNLFQVDIHVSLALFEGSHSTLIVVCEVESLSVRM